MNFSEFNETIKSQLNNLTSHNRLPHAIIITGGNEELRNSVADYLCVYAVCSEENKPCYNCKNCKKAMSHIHPDISYVQGKVYVFKDVDEKLPVISQNAFLKTLEEPPQNILFVMTCKDASVLLETILSRSTVINIQKEDEFSTEGVSIAEEIALALLDINEYKLLSATYKVNNKDSFNQTIPYLKLLIRDTLSLTVGSDKLSNSSVPEKLTRKLTREKSLSLLNTIEKAQRMMKSNVNQNLLSTWLCSEFRRITWQQ